MLVECLLHDVLRVTDDDISIADFAVTLQHALVNVLAPITIHLLLALSAIVDVTVMMLFARKHMHIDPRSLLLDSRSSYLLVSPSTPDIAPRAVFTLA